MANASVDLARPRCEVCMNGDYPPVYSTARQYAGITLLIVTSVVLVTVLALLYIRRRLFPLNKRNLWLIGCIIVPGAISGPIVFGLREYLGQAAYPCWVMYMSFSLFIPVAGCAIYINILRIVEVSKLQTMMASRNSLRMDSMSLDGKLSPLEKQKRRTTNGHFICLQLVMALPAWLAYSVVTPLTTDIFTGIQYGCAPRTLDSACNLLYAFAWLLVLGPRLRKQLQHVKETLNLRREVTLIMRAIALLIPTYYTVLYGFPNGEFSQSWLASIFFFWVMYVVAIKPLRATFRHRRSHRQSKILSTAPGKDGGSDLMLSDLLAEEMGCTSFLDFCKSEFSSENLLFWRAVNSFRTRVDERPELLEPLCQHLKRRYVTVDSPMQVNISDRQRRQLLKKLDSGPLTVGIFNDAQAEIFKLMERDSFPRYLRSAFYSDLLSTLQSGSFSAKSSTKLALMSITDLDELTELATLVEEEEQAAEEASKKGAEGAAEKSRTTSGYEV